MSRLSQFRLDLESVLEEYGEYLRQEADDILTVLDLENQPCWTVNIIEYPTAISVFNHHTGDMDMKIGQLKDIIPHLLPSGSYIFDDDSPGDKLMDSDFEYDQSSNDHEFNEDEFHSEINWESHEHLPTDLHILKDCLGADAVRVNTFSIANKYEVIIELPVLNLMSQLTADAWNVQTNQSIKISLTFGGTVYLNSPETPQVAIYQEHISKNFGLRFQLESICRDFLRIIWPLLTEGEAFELHHVPCTQQISQIHNKKKSNTGQKKPAKKQTLAVSKKIKKINNKEVKQLVNMGFTQDEAKEALSRNQTVEQALDWLLAHQADIDDDEQQSSGFWSTITTGLHDWLVGQEKAYDDFQTDDQPTKKRKANSEWLHLPIQVQDILTQIVEKGIINTDHGLFYLIITYLISRTKTLNNYCIICDQPHVFGMNNMLKPTICARALCCFSYQQLGVAADSAQYVAGSAEVVELLILLAKIAAGSSRADKIFDPFPLLVDRENADKLILDPKKKDFKLAKQILGGFPSMEHLAETNDFNQMQDLMNSAHPHSFQLLQWLITSNRCHIVKLGEEQQIPELKSSHQFLMLSQAPEREARFAELKAKYGSTFAFHGSPIDNWHAIMRQGLKNASGTKLQLHGAAYGKGIYLSPNSGVSAGYSAMNYYNNNQTSSQSSINNRFLNTENIRCIAICEVIKHGFAQQSGDVWVMPNEEHVCTRFLIVYPNQSQMGGCRTDQMTPSLLKALAYYGL